MGLAIVGGGGFVVVVVIVVVFVDGIEYLLSSTHNKPSGRHLK